MTGDCGARKERFFGNAFKRKKMSCFFHEKTEKSHPIPGLRGPNGSIGTSDEENRKVPFRRQLLKATPKMLYDNDS